MKKDILIKTVLVILIIFITLLTLKTTVNAMEIGNPVDHPASYNPDYYKSVTLSDAELKQRIGNILGTINIFGMVVSVVALMIIGIKYMIGSIEEKAEYKKVMTIYLLGAILIFSLTTIPNILYKIGTSIK